MSDIDNQEKRRRIADTVKVMRFNAMLKAAGKIDRALKKINWNNIGWD